jgi:hypothetical protein
LTGEARGDNVTGNAIDFREVTPMGAGRSLVAVILVFLAARASAEQAAATADPKAAKAPKAEKKKSPRASGAGGLVVFVDPVTGEIREPDAAEIGDLLSPPGAAASREIPEDRPLVMKTGPGGAVGVVLDSRFESFLVVTKTPDGKLAMECVTGGKKADEIVAAGAKKTAKPDEKEKDVSHPR